jgi:hypothetical protein
MRFCLGRSMPEILGNVPLPLSPLTLALFVLGILANNPYLTEAFDDLALHAHLFYRRTDFHNKTFQNTKNKKNFKFLVIRTNF